MILENDKTTIYLTLTTRPTSGHEIAILINDNPSVMARGSYKEKFESELEPYMSHIKSYIKSNLDALFDAYVVEW